MTYYTAAEVKAGHDAYAADRGWTKPCDPDPQGIAKPKPTPNRHRPLIQMRQYLVYERWRLAVRRGDERTWEEWYKAFPMLKSLHHDPDPPVRDYTELHPMPLPEAVEFYARWKRRTVIYRVAWKAAMDGRLTVWADPERKRRWLTTPDEVRRWAETLGETFPRSGAS